MAGQAMGLLTASLQSIIALLFFLSLLGVWGLMGFTLCSLGLGNWSVIWT